MSLRTGCKLLFACYIGLCAAVAFAQYSNPGGGVDDSNGVFQLEGNATLDSAICFNPTGGPDGGPLLATPSGTSCPNGYTYVAFSADTEDWATVAAAVNSGGTTKAIATSFVGDKFNSPSDESYTGGSTKDTLDITGWLWKGSKPQGKDDIEHAYAAAYINSVGHVILVAGADRWDNSGDSTMGFWFVKNSSIGSGVTTCNVGSGCSFGGSHSDGDLLIVSDFSQGGPVASIAVFLWKTNYSGFTDCTPNTAPGLCRVTTIPAASIGECNPITGSKDLCGIVPDQNVPAPWTFVDKHLGTVPNFEKGEFLEVGLDLSTIFASAPCFSTFFAETRASTTPSSTLSDFTKPVSFPLCSITATKSCTSATIDAGGATITWNFGGTITGKGGTMTNVSIADNPNGCGYQTTNVTGQVCSSGGQNPQIVSALVLNQPVVGAGGLPPGPPGVSYSGSFKTNFNDSTFDNLAQASATSPDGSTITGPANGASWLVSGSNGCTPSGSGCLQLTKSCDGSTITSGSPLTIQFSVSGDITNNSNVLVSNITIVDSPSPDGGSISVTCGTGCTGTGNGSFNLAPGGTATYSLTYTKSGTGLVCTPTIGDGTGRCSFVDTVTASGAGALGAGTINSCAPPVQATCHLCPTGSCSTGQ